MKIIILVIIGIYVLSGLVLYFLQEKIIFQGKRLSQDHKFEFETPFEEVHLTAGEAQLHALHFKVASPKGVILYYHGNSGNLSRWGKEVQYLVGLGHDVLVMDYRGYGKSRGHRTMENLLEDAVLFYEYTRKQYAEDRITVYGRSLGTGLATYVAGRNQPARVILETPYHEFKSVVQRFVPVFPIGLGLRFNFKSQEYIQNVKRPIYIFHGTEDSIVPYVYGQKLYESVSSGNAEFIGIEDGQHKNLIEFEEFRKRMEGILN